MLSTDEVYHATIFMQAYKEALDTVEYYLLFIELSPPS